VRILLSNYQLSVAELSQLTPLRSGKHCPKISSPQHPSIYSASTDSFSVPAILNSAVSTLVDLAVV